MDIQSFTGQLKALEISSTSKGHKYSPIEQVLAYYVARNTVSKDTQEVMIMKNNRINSTNLTLSSFGMMVSNMSFAIYGKGNSRISEQGMNVARFLNKEFLNKRLDNAKLKELINSVYGEKLL